jgi:ABC-type Fe3+ transport system permease subunit
VTWHITLKFLRPAIIGAGAVAFLMSFENFNTTLFLVGSDATLPINLYRSDSGRQHIGNQCHLVSFDRRYIHGGGCQSLFQQKRKAFTAA